jgi:hypothetical protein
MFNRRFVHPAAWFVDPALSAWKIPGYHPRFPGRCGVCGISDAISSSRDAIMATFSLGNHKKRYAGISVTDTLTYMFFIFLLLNIENCL